MNNRGNLWCIWRCLFNSTCVYVADFIVLIENVPDLISFNWKFLLRLIAVALSKQTFKHSRWALIYCSNRYFMYGGHFSFIWASNCVLIKTELKRLCCCRFCCSWGYFSCCYSLLLYYQSGKANDFHKLPGDYKVSGFSRRKLECGN